MSVENAVFIPAVLEYVNSGRTAILPLRGYSMRPFLEDGRDKALLVKPDKINVGDPVLAEISPLHYVLHRVWKIEGEHLTLMGDGNLTPEHCNVGDVRASVKAFYRKGRPSPDQVSGLKWRTYSWLWIKLYPVRRWLLAIYRRLPHVKRRVARMNKENK